MDTGALAKALEAVTNPFALVGYVVLVIGVVWAYYNLATLKALPPEARATELERRGVKLKSGMTVTGWLKSRQQLLVFLSLVVVALTVVLVVALLRPQLSTGAGAKARAPGAMPARYATASSKSDRGRLRPVRFGQTQCPLDQTKAVLANRCDGFVTCDDIPVNIGLCPHTADFNAGQKELELRYWCL